MTKFELSISSGYVPNWGIVEAMREIFQNALDNEITNPENKMQWLYDKETETLTVSNKTSVLPVQSLLLGSSTKADDPNTIGKHGEGYKIAFMVLLRNNKKIKVYNYGAKEIWEVRLVKSKKYNGEMVTTVFVDKEPVWKKVPNSNLTIEITGISDGEYKDIVEKNLHLRSDTISKFKVPGRGDIILNKEESGNIYVKGLFVSKLNDLHYGYDFEPNVLGLDRDRKLVDSFNISWESSILWQVAATKDEKLISEAVKLYNNKALDVAYVHKISYSHHKLSDAIAEDFYETHGNDAVPVSNNAEYEEVKESGSGKPVIVDDRTVEVIKKSSVVKEHSLAEVKTLQQKFYDFLDKIESKLSDEEVDEFKKLIEKV